jgi:hypothetical protein
MMQEINIKFGLFVGKAQRLCNDAKSGIPWHLGSECPGRKKKTFRVYSDITSELPFFGKRIHSE